MVISPSTCFANSSARNSGFPGKWLSNALLILMFAAMSRLFWGCFAEDSFIVARYAANVLHGHGLVYNPGEPINALTSPLHVLVLIPLQAIFKNAIKGYTILCAIGMFALAFFAAKTLFHEKIRQAMFLICVAMFPPLCFWTVGGLETPILTMIAIGLIVAWKSPETKRTASIVLALCAASILTRYDAILLFGPAALYTLIRHRNDSAARITAATACAIGAVWFLGSYLFFHDLLPTSFYTKTPNYGSFSGMTRGALYEANFLALLACPIVLILLLARWRSPSKSIVPEPIGIPDWPLFAGITLYFAYGLSAGIIHMMYLYRLFVPCAPWLFVLTVGRLRFTPTLPGLIAAICFQFTVACLVYTKGLNFNFTLFFTPQTPFAENFEFSTVGAVANKKTDRAFASQARDLRAHWNERPASELGVTPRIHSITEGQPPYELPEFHVYGPLVGYRHDCHADTLASSHYQQRIYWVHSPDDPDPEKSAWKVISKREVPAVTWAGEAILIRLEWLFQPNPETNRIPATIDAPCLVPSSGTANPALSAPTPATTPTNT